MNLAIFRIPPHQLVLYICAFCLLFFSYKAGQLHDKPIIKITKQESAININEEIALILSMGQARMIADFLWITTLIESDVDHYKQKDLNSWIFLRFKSLLTFDPRFLKAYRFGGQYLSIVKDDLQGAAYIFEQGLKKYPDDYDLNFNAGFLYAFELEDYEKAIPIYEKIVTYPQAPPFIKTLLGKLKYEASHSKEDIFTYLFKIYNETQKDEYIFHKLEQDLYSLRAEIDLECLNLGKSNCKHIDFFGNPYIKTSGKFKSKLNIQKYELHR